MVDASMPKVPLGVSGLVADSFSLFFRRLHVVMLIGFVPYFIYGLLQTAVVGVAGPVDPLTGQIDWGALALMMILAMAVFSVVTSMLTEAAYDAKLGRPARLGAYFVSGLRRIVPVLVLSIIAYIGLVIGLLALIVPGLWVAAVLSVIVPAIVVENAGFGGLRRSVVLTKEYRWPIVGLFLLLFVIAFAIGIVLAIIVGGIAFGVLSGGVDPTAGLSNGVLILLQALNALSSALTSGFLCITLALLYARLREIKEGISVDQIADVFN